LSAGWHAAIRETYAPVIEASAPPAELGEPAVRPADLGGEMNIGPALSPDGRWVAFYSERGLLSIDLFIADTSTGEVVRRLTSTATDPHYSSIQFINSAGGWDSESRRLVIATVRDGRPALAIFDAFTGDRLEEIRLPDLDEVFNPVWSPDNGSIAFTGMDGGLTNLFVHDLKTGEVRRLTNDPWADLMPAWSPDGRRIAFATDRFSSDLTTLEIGNYRLALIDVATGAVEEVAAFPEGKHINPQWSPDGQSLYFLSDHDGVPNLYRIVLGGGGPRQITRVATGLSGITSSSPALSVAAERGTLAFTVYQDGKYHINKLEAGAEGTEPIPPSTRAAALPPLERQTSDVAALLGDEQIGLPGADEEFETEDYDSSLTLEAVGAPSISVGADRFGAAIGGGIGFQFGDMLGDQTLSVALQLNAGLSGRYSVHNTAAQALYYNAARRWNWGVVGGQTPYLSGGTQTGVGFVGNEPAQIEQTIVFRQTERSVAGVLAYPFSRAQRVEWQAGISRISFDEVVTTTGFSLRTGQLLIDDTVTTPLGDPLNLATTSMALVYDSAVLGAASPVQGQRYRFEAIPMFGTINLTNVLTDYRRYFMPVSFYTIAGRVLHYGRYGSGSEDGRLSPLFLGYPNLVRGYDVNNIGAGVCNFLSDCAAYEEVTGSRMLVGNLEFRFPLLRPFGQSTNMYGPLPTEVALFVDGGVAWREGQRPSFLGGDRDGIGSAGVALRVNLAGFAIGQFSLARPFSSQERGWVFQFNLSPGF
jgi:Tol biopolymer transport system component